MRVLVGCECSQTVAGAFLRAGHDAYSCDISPAYGSYPDRHLQGDLRLIYAKVNPDLFIAHPPCTFLSRAGLGRLVPTDFVTPGASWTAVHYSQRIRSKTFDGVAAAMVDQWGGSVSVQLRFDWR